MVRRNGESGEKRRLLQKKQKSKLRLWRGKEDCVTKVGGGRGDFRICTRETRYLQWSKL